MSAKKNAKWSLDLPTREEQYLRKRRALVQEAGRAFGKAGFHNTSLDDVAKALNVTKAALYYYIKTKQEILFECHSLALDLGEQARQFAWQGSDQPLERLRLWLRKYIQLLTGDIGCYAVLAEPISSLDETHQKLIRDRLRTFDRHFQQLVIDAIADGTLPNCDPRLAVAFFMGAINNISRWFTPNTDLNDESITAAFEGFIFHGLLSDHRFQTAPAETTDSRVPVAAAST
jgi:AcrR family transcriptional regulator